MENKKIRYLISVSVIIMMIAGVFSLPVVNDDYAVSAATKKVKVTFNANGGKIGAANKKIKRIRAGSKIGKLPAAKRTGHTLKGWYTKRSGGKKITKFTRVKKKMTVYARWAAKKYTLTFNANGGSTGTKYKKVTFGKTYGTLPTPTLNGYKFDGWYTSKTGGTKVSSITKTTAARDTIVFAHWKKVLNSEEQKLVGIWSTSTITPGYYNTMYSSPTLTIEKWNEGSFFASATVFNADGTGHEVYVASKSYGWNTWKWRSDGTKVYFSNIVSNNVDNEYSGSNWTDRVYPDSWSLYKVRTNTNGMRQYVRKPDFRKDTEEYAWTIDEYIADGYPTWLNKQD